MFAVSTTGRCFPTTSSFVPGGMTEAASQSAALNSSAALCELGHWLAAQQYRFTCPTPETHARVNARAQNVEALGLEDVFGWSRPFRRDLLPQSALELLNEAAALELTDQDLLRSKVRYSSVDQHLFLHSAYPTDMQDAVFFGPDTYRFINLIRQTLATPWAFPVRSLVDIGCGTGAGGLMAMQALDPKVLQRAVFSDINPLALQFAASNASINRVAQAEFIRSDGLAAVDGYFDLIISNPPYMIDRSRRAYCHGGEAWGTELALRFLHDAIAQLAPGGRLILYTGTPVIKGRNVFELESQKILSGSGLSYRHIEIDPDVFGEDLDQAEYAEVDRIAVVGLLASRGGESA